MRSVPILVSIALLLVMSGIAVGVGAESPTIPDGSVDLTEPDRPVLVYDVSLAGDGSAEWNVSIFFPTENETEEVAYRRVAAEFEDDDGDDYLPIAPFEASADDASEALNRSMSIHGVERTTSESDAVGILSLTFTWSGFAHVDDPYLSVGDVFSATQEPWLTSLNEDEYLLIHPPDGYQVEDSGMKLANRTMWEAGPADLTESSLQGRYIQESATANGGSPLSMAVLGGLGAGMALLLLFLGTAYQRGWRPFDVREGSDTAALDEEPTDTAEGVSDEKPEEDGPDLSLLSDEERVLQLIEAEGGRMKQATIVEETDWSNAKVSQLLSTMAENGSVEKLRLGRENLISLPDEDGQ